MVKKTFVQIDHNDTSEIEKKLSQHDTKEERPIDQEIVKPKKSEYKIALDDATIETLKQRHNLTERTSKASFHWKTSHHKALKNLCNDTDKSAEEYLAEWAIAGLEKARKSFYKEI